MANRYDSIGDALVGRYGALSLTGKDGCVLASGQLPGTQSSMSMDINPLNGLSLRHDVPLQEPKIALNAQGVTLTAGPPGVGAQLQLNATGITLQFGPPGVGSSIQIDATGITFKAGPTTTVQLTPAGINLKGLTMNVEADALYKLATKVLTESVTGFVSRSALIQKIG
jgi:hypothetical protein